MKRIFPWFSVLSLFLLQSCRFVSGEIHLRKARRLEDTCIGDVENFDAGIFLKVVGRPSDVLGNDLELLEQTVLEAYNELVVCNEEGAYIAVDTVTILVNAIDAFGDEQTVVSALNQNDETREFTWLVEFQGSCRGCDVNRLIGDSLGDNTESRRTLPWRQPPGYIGCRCDAPSGVSLVELINDNYDSPNIDSIQALTQLDRIDDCNPGEASLEFNTTLLVKVESAWPLGSTEFEEDIAVLEQAMLETYNELNLRSSETCDSLFRQVTSVNLSSCQTQSSGGGDSGALTLAFDVIATCTGCNTDEATIFDVSLGTASRRLEDGVPLCYCPQDSIIQGTTRDAFLDAMEDILQYHDTSDFGLSVDIPLSFVEVDALEIPPGLTNFTSQFTMVLDLSLDNITDTEIVVLEDSIVVSYNEEWRRLIDLGVICDLEFLRLTTASIDLTIAFEDDMRRRTLVEGSDYTVQDRLLQSDNTTEVIGNGTLCDEGNSTAPLNGTDCNSTGTISPAPTTTLSPVSSPTPAPAVPTPAPNAAPGFGIFGYVEVPVDVMGVCRGCDFNINLFDDIRRRNLRVEEQRILNLCGDAQVVFCPTTAEQRPVSSNEFGRSLEVVLTRRREQGELTNIGTTVESVQRATQAPTQTPVSAPPSVAPSELPSSIPSNSLSQDPSQRPSGALPSDSPTAASTGLPSHSPSDKPTLISSLSPSIPPSGNPTSLESLEPSSFPTSSPSWMPSPNPSAKPSSTPSDTPSLTPSGVPSASPSTTPSLPPSQEPSAAPSIANDICEGATSLEFNSSYIASESASTEYALVDTSDVDSCSQFTTGRLSRGVWYTMFGNEDFVRATTCSGDLSFNSVISVFRGRPSCDDLRCVDQDAGVTEDSDESSNFCGDPQASTVSWFSESGTTYFILVHGVAEDDAGRFTLTVERNLNAVNDGCLDAKQISFPTLGELGSTEFAFADAYALGECDADISTYEDSHAVWYRLSVPASVLGVVASTCNSDVLNFNSGLTVFLVIDACESFECVATQVIDCEDDGLSQLFWTKARGTTAEYFVVVHGVGPEDYGNFELTVVATA